MQVPDAFDPFQLYPKHDLVVVVEVIIHQYHLDILDHRTCGMKCTLFRIQEPGEVKVNIKLTKPYSLSGRIPLLRVR